MSNKKDYRDSTGYLELAIAICARAADDYLLLRRRSSRGWWDPGMKEIKKHMIEDFFLGQFGNIVALGRGAEILETLRKEEAHK